MSLLLRHQAVLIETIKTLFTSASRHCSRGRPVDKGTSVLWLVHVWNPADAYQDFPGWASVAGCSSVQRCDECGQVFGVSPPVERHPVCLLHACWGARVYCWVSLGFCLRGFLCVQAHCTFVHELPCQFADHSSWKHLNITWFGQKYGRLICGFCISFQNTFLWL